jgi:large subunit ribosomal protein L32
MPNPKKRHSKARRDKRRANWKLEAPNMSLCPQCRQPKMPHRVCPTCGHYNGKEIITADEA